jgi:hypothetical protein
MAKKDQILGAFELNGSTITVKAPFELSIADEDGVARISHEPDSGNAEAQLQINASGGTEYTSILFQVDGVTKWTVGQGTGDQFYIYEDTSGETPFRCIKTRGTIALDPTPTVPATAAATGVKGEISWDADYIYVCTATNTWKRAALATWP